MNEYEQNEERSQPNKRLGMGLILIAVGAILISNNFGLIPENISRVLVSWQMLIIAIGTVNLFTDKNKTWPWVVITVGVCFLLPRIFNIPDEMKQMLWPSIFIAIGLVLLLTRGKKKTECKKGHDKLSADYLDEVYVFGGGNKVITSDNFQGGKVTAIFGGAEMDLTNATIQDKEVVLDLFMMFGGGSIVVPSNWDVQVQVTSIFGGFADERKLVTTYDSNLKKQTLIIKGTALFGGGEIKSY